MNASRRALVAFAVAIGVTLATRPSPLSPLPRTDPFVYGGLVLATGAWVVGCYYGYQATRDADGDGT